MENEILSPSAMPLGTSFRRNVNEPLDVSSVFPSLAIAETYAHNITANENYCPYDGQIITVRQGSDNESHIYKLVPATGEEDWLDGYDTSKDYNADGILNKFHYNLIEILGADRTLDTKEGGTVDGLVNFDGGATATNLLVTGTLQVNEVNINHIKHSGGVFLNTRANIVVSEVTELTGVDLGKTKLTFTRTAGSQTIYNLFEVGDFALSMMFNLKETEGYQIGNDGLMTWQAGDGTTLIDVVRYYWREVVAVGSDYITLGAVPNNVNMSAPKVGDNVVQLGNNTNDSSRQGCQVMGYSKTNGVFIAEYDGLTTNIKDSKAYNLAKAVFDRPDDAIVYLSPKKHKLQGDEIKLKATSQQGSSDLTLTADTINAITNDLSLKADTATVNSKELNINNKIATVSTGSLKLALNENGAVLQMLDANGQVVGNLGATLLISNTDGTMSGILNYTNGQWTFRDDFTVRAGNVDFTAGAINMNTAKFTIGTDTNVTLFQSGKIKTDYIDVNTLKAALINAGIINANDIVTDALTASATFNAHQATIQNLKVTGSSEFGGELKGATGTFTGDISAASGAFGGSVVIKEGNTPRIKIDGTNIATNEEAGNTRIVHLAPNGLLVLVDQNQYVLVKTDGIEMRWGNDGVKLGSGGLKRYNGSEWVDMYAKPLTISVNSTTILPANVQNVVCSGSGFNITLPSGADAGTQIMIKGTTSGNNYVSIYPPSGERISTTERSGVSYKNLYDDDCCWLTKLNTTWYWNYAEV